MINELGLQPSVGSTALCLQPRREWIFKIYFHSLSAQTFREQHNTNYIRKTIIMMPAAAGQSLLKPVQHTHSSPSGTDSLHVQIFDTCWNALVASDMQQWPHHQYTPLQQLLNSTLQHYNIQGSTNREMILNVNQAHPS